MKLHILFKPPPPATEDLALRFHQGDMAALKEIILIHQKGIYRIGLQLFFNRDTAARKHRQDFFLGTGDYVIDDAARVGGCSIINAPNMNNEERIIRTAVIHPWVKCALPGKNVGKVPMIYAKQVRPKANAGLPGSPCEQAASVTGMLI